MISNRRFVANWGDFTVILDETAGHHRVEIRRRDDGRLEVAMPDLPRRSRDAAIRWAADQLEQRGAVAFVDGKRRSLSDFVVFTELGE